MRRLFLAGLVVAGVLASAAGGSRTAPAPKPPTLLWSMQLAHTEATVTFDGISLDSRGDVFVADTARGRVLELDPNGHQLRTWGSKGRGHGHFDFRHVENGAYYDSGGVAVDLHGNVYVSEAGTERVQKFDSHGRWLLQWGGPPATAGHGAFGNLIGVATDRVGNVYTDDDHAYETVQKFDSAGKFLKVVSAGKISDAGGIAVSPRGQLYAADFVAGRVARFTTAGHLLGEFGSGPGRAPLSAPIGLAVQTGDLFVADSGNSRIAEFTPSGKFVAQFTGAGSGKLTRPSSLAVDEARHRLLVYDQGSARLLAFKLSG